MLIVPRVLEEAFNLIFSRWLDHEALEYMKDIGYK